MERHELREISIESCLLGQASRRPKPSSQAEDGDATAICQSADDKQNKTVADGSHAWRRMGTGWENPTIGATLGAGQPVSWSDSLTNFWNQFQTHFLSSNVLKLFREKETTNKLNKLKKHCHQWLQAMCAFEGTVPSPTSRRWSVAPHWSWATCCASLH